VCHLNIEGGERFIDELNVASQTIVPSFAPGSPKFNIEPAAIVSPAPFTVSVVPCAAAMVEVPDNARVFVKVSLAVANSSPPLWITVPVPNAPPLPNSMTPPAARPTLAIVLALLSCANPEMTWSSPSIVSEPEFSSSAPVTAFKTKEFAKSALLTETVYGGPRSDMKTVSAWVGTAPVDQSVATLQSPLTGSFQSILAMSSLPSRSQRFSALHVGARGLIVQKQTEKRAQPATIIGGAEFLPPPEKTDHSSVN
jgi:hypothetical protein